MGLREDGEQVQNLDEGVATHVFAAFDPTIAKNNGGYFDDCQLADPFKEQVYSWATSKPDAEMLWTSARNWWGRSSDTERLRSTSDGAGNDGEDVR